jgi:hypothetical protein
VPKATALDRSVRGRVRRLLASGDFSGRAGESMLLPEVPGLASARLLLIGLGNKAQYSRRGWRRALQTPSARWLAPASPRPPSRWSGRRRRTRRLLLRPQRRRDHRRHPVPRQ